MQVRETATEVMPPQTADVASAAVLPELGPISDRLRAWHVPIVAEVGRAGLAWFALAVVYGSDNPNGRRGRRSHARCIDLARGIQGCSLTLTCSCSDDSHRRDCGVAIGLRRGRAQRISVGLNLSWPWPRGRGARRHCNHVGVGRVRRHVSSPAEEAGPLRRSRRAGRAAARGVRRCRHAGFEIFGACDAGADAAMPPRSGRSAWTSSSGVVEAQHPDVVVLADEKTFDEAVDRLLESPATRIRVASLAGFCEYVLGRVPIEHIGRRGSCAS